MKIVRLCLYSGLCLLIGLDAKTAQLNMNSSGGSDPKGPTYTLTTDETYVGNTGSAMAGAGVFVSGVANNSTINLAGNTFTSGSFASRNVYGIYSDTGAVLNINDGKLVVGNNRTGDSNWGSGFGIYAKGDGSNHSTINVANANIDISDNGLYGVIADTGGLITFNGNTNSGNNTFTANANSVQTASGLRNYGMGVYASGVSSEVKIKDMKSVEASDNGGYGVYAHSGGSVDIDGLSNGTSTLTTNNNKAWVSATDWNVGYGIIAELDGSEVKIKDVKYIEANNNGSTGVYTEFGGLIDIKGLSDGTSVLSANNNKTSEENGYLAGRGIFSNGATSVINIDKTSITASDNGDVGILLMNDAKLNVTGMADGTNTLEINNNGRLNRGWGKGIFVDGTNSHMSVSDMDVEISGNRENGIYAVYGGSVDITGLADGTNKLIVNDTRQDGEYEGIGIDAREGDSQVNITNMDVEVKNSSWFGIMASSGGIVNITGIADGSNKLTVNDTVNTSPYSVHGGFGISSASEINITNMNVEVNGNEDGIVSSGKLNIMGVADGSNKLVANNNHNRAIILQPGHAAGIGIYTNSSGEIDIINMDVEANENGTWGVVAYDSSTINITGIADGSNKLVSQKNVHYEGTDGIGIYAGLGSEINVTDMDIDVSENGMHGVLATHSSKINLKGVDSGTSKVYANNNTNSIIAGNAGKGFHAYEADSQVNITNMDVEASGNGFYGIFAELGGVVNVKGITSGSNTLVLKDNGAYGVAALSGVTGSEVNLANLNITSEGNNLFLAGDGGKIELNDIDVTMNDNLDLLNVNSGIGTFVATDSTLNNQMVTGASATSNVILTDSTWNMYSNSNISNLALNDSMVDMRNSAAGSYNNLTLSGLNSSGSGIVMNTFLGGDGSPTDQLILDNAIVSGTTTLNVRGIGAGGDTVDGIKLVDAVNGTTTLATNFTLLGGVVDSGAYEYELFRGDVAGVDNQSFFLRSTYVPTNTFNAMANTTATQLSFVKTGMNELRKRLGELRDNNPEHLSGIWARSYATSLSVDDSINSSMNVFGFESGIDRQVYADCDDKVFVGLMAGYMYTDNIRTHGNRLYRGEADANTPSVGAYVTWLNKDGWFVDLVARHFWSDMSVTTYNSQGGTVAYDVKRNFMTGDIEVGRQFRFFNTGHSRYVVEPKLELQYTYANSDSFGTTSGNRVYYSDTESVMGKASVMLGYNTKLENEMILEPFVQVGVINEFDGKTDIRYSNGLYKSDLGGIGVEFGGGLNAKLSDNWNLYTDVMYETGEAIRSISTNLGIRYNF